MEQKENHFLGKHFILIGLLVLLALGAIWAFFGPKGTAGEKIIEVSVTHSDGKENTYTVKTQQEFLRGALEEIDLIAGEESSYGLFVLTVDGETADQDKQEWWGYTRQGEYVEYSVDQCAIQDGEQYEFTFHVGW